MTDLYMKPRVFQSKVWILTYKVGNDIVLPLDHHGLTVSSSPLNAIRAARVHENDVSDVRLDEGWVWYCTADDLMEQTAPAFARTEPEAWDQLVRLHTNLFEVRGGRITCSGYAMAASLGRILAQRGVQTSVESDASGSWFVIFPRPDDVEQATRYLQNAGLSVHSF